MQLHERVRLHRTGLAALQSDRILHAGHDAPPEVSSTMRGHVLDARHEL